jgi:hypothetical protein
MASLIRVGGAQLHKESIVMLNEVKHFYSFALKYLCGAAIGDHRDVSLHST